jgi:uncharacterized membrane protein (UPF0182 family)
LRLVVLALQDRLAYGATFEEALAGLFGNAASMLPGPLPSAASGLAIAAPAHGQPAQTGAPRGADFERLIGEAARHLADYQRLTAEGKLGEAGQQLESLKRALDQLDSRRAAAAQ